MWVVYTIAATLLLSLSTVFAKCGIKRADSSVVTALRTLIVALFLWIVIFSEGSHRYIPSIGGTSFLYLVLSGLTFAGSLLCYHIALKAGDVTRVSALEKVTTLIIMAALVFIHNYTSMLYIRIICMVLIAVGVILVITRRSKSGSGRLLLFGLLSAVLAVATYVLAVTGISIDSHDLTLTLTLTIVLLISLIAVFIRGLQRGISRIPVSEFMFIILSGLSAGLAWLCFRTAYYSGHTDTVLAITSMSIATSAALAALFLKEKVSWKTICGLLLIITGTLMYVFMV